MSEAIQTEQSPYPGEAWTEIVRRPTLEEFSRAFASDVVLEASVLSRPIVGPMSLWGFSRRPVQCTTGSVSPTKSARRRECAWSGKGSSPAIRWPASPSLHGTTAGRSRACDYIIAPGMVSTERNGDQCPRRDFQTAAVTARVKERADSVHREHQAIVVAIEQRDADSEFWVVSYSRGKN
jgi:hypothetical protein